MARRTRGTDSERGRPRRTRGSPVGDEDLAGDVAGDIVGEDDEEYSEAVDETKDSDPDVEDEYREDEEFEGRSRSRKRRIKNEEPDENDEEDEEDEVDDEADDGDDKAENEDGAEDADGAEDGVEDGAEGEDQQSKKRAKPERKIPKKRGRKKMKITYAEDGAFDEEGNPLNIDDDEVVIENEDPKGKEKIDSLGRLQGGRMFRVKTFTVLGNGDKLYMVSTEPARLVGFRDSYLLFKTHRSLFKKVCTNEEKMDLIDRQIIPNSYKGRSVNLVAARSIYREFGAKIIKDGKKVNDDFWEQRAIDNGDVAGEDADPGEMYSIFNKQGFSDNIGNTPAPVVLGAPQVNYQSDPTWMYQIAVQMRNYNSRLLEQRNQALRGVRDVYTGLNFYPQSTQPTHARFKWLGPSENIVYDMSFVNSNIRRRFTGLKDVPREVYEDLDDELKLAIQEQQAYERSF